MVDTDTVDADNDKQDDSEEDDNESREEGSGEEECSGEDEIKEPENSGEKVTEEEEDESAKGKTKQMTISAIWSNVAGASLKPPSSGRTASPARFRRAEDRSPADNDKRETKKRKGSNSGKKQAQVKNINKKNAIVYIKQM